MMHLSKPRKKTLPIDLCRSVTIKETGADQALLFWSAANFGAENNNISLLLLLECDCPILARGWLNDFLFYSLICIV